MGTVTLTNTFVDAAVIEADEFNENFTDLTDAINGSLDGDNISSSAALSIATLATSGAATVGSTLAVTGKITATAGVGFRGARAYLNADQDNIAGAGADTYRINLNAESYDVGSDFTSYYYLVPITGYYQVNGQVIIEATDVTAGAYFYAAIFVDPLGVGSPAVKTRGVYNEAAANADWIGSSVSDIIYLTATDKVYLYAYVGDTDADIESGEYNTFMSIALIGT
jgi:hypothetical protein